jgi:hypothetical protein
MNLFRSEEHVSRWLGARSAGASITAETLCDLAHAWWDTRLRPDWRPRACDESQAILERLELTGAFWTLA